jgi:RNA polymerase sigma factor (sigma-70 family)
MDQHAPVSVAADELEALYLALSRRLEQLVRMDVRAPEAVIEDACQVAWIRLVRNADRVRRDAVLSWLATTAVREAYKLTRRESRELSLDAALEHADGLPGVPRSPGPHEVLEQRERLARLRALPERQQRLLWLHALGYSYAEMATHDGLTRRTVERQLLRAKGRVRGDGGLER